LSILTKLKVLLEESHNRKPAPHLWSGPFPWKLTACLPQVAPADVPTVTLGNGEISPGAVDVNPPMEVIGDEVMDVNVAIGVTSGVNMGAGVGVAALHPAMSIARSTETIAMTMNAFFIFFTFPLWFRVYIAQKQTRSCVQRLANWMKFPTQRPPPRKSFEKLSGFTIC